MKKKKFDVIIVGAGVVGCAIARELSRYNLDILLVEKELDVATGTSKANTGIIHAGYDAIPQTLMGKLNVKGNALFTRLADELQVPFKRIGSLVVAMEGDNVAVLEQLVERGQKNGVKDLCIVERDWLKKHEPHLSAKAVAALLAATAGIISPWRLTLGMAQNAQKNGATVMLETEVQGIYTENNQVVGIKTERGSFGADYLINAAGIFSGEVARMAGIEEISIKPDKGQYYVYDWELDLKVNHVVFPLPNSESKGIVVAPTVDGNLLAGPSSGELVDKDDLSTSREVLAKVASGSSKLFPGLAALNGRISAFAGLRATVETGDFIIEAVRKVKGFINVAGIQSPGLSCAPSIAHLVVEILKETGLEMTEKDHFDPKQEKPISFQDLSDTEKADLIDKSCQHGQIVCRCETVTQQEIVDAIHDSIGARTVDAVKRRTRAGMGRCQGGFCVPRVVMILTEELGIDFTEIRKEERDSYIFL